MLCVDVVAECDRYVGERWERGVCTGKEGGPGGVRGVEGGRGGQSATIHPHLCACVWPCMCMCQWPCEPSLLAPHSSVRLAYGVPMACHCRVCGPGSGFPWLTTRVSALP